MKIIAASPILKTITHAQLLLLMLFYSAIALIFAYISQFVFDYQPCILCIYQRLPFFAVLLIAFFSLLPFIKIKKRIALFACLLMLAGNATLAAYHVGVERKIFKGPNTCQSSMLDDIDNLEDLKTALKSTKAVRCDEPNFVFLGVSMAAWNVIYCLFLIFSTITLLPRNAHGYPGSGR